MRVLDQMNSWKENRLKLKQKRKQTEERLDLLLWLLCDGDVIERGNYWRHHRVLVENALLYKHGHGM